MSDISLGFKLFQIGVHKFDINITILLTKNVCVKTHIVKTIVYFTIHLFINSTNVYWIPICLWLHQILGLQRLKDRSYQVGEDFLLWEVFPEETVFGNNLKYEPVLGI